MAINLYSKASVDSLLSAKLSISSLTNAAATTLNATAPTTGQVLSFDGTELKWATPAGGATWGSITGTLSSQSDLNTALNARVSTAGDTMDNNAILEFNDTTTNSHLGITGNAVTIENSGLGLSSTLDKDKLSITDGTDTAEISLSGVKFADGSVQTTAFTGGGSWLGNRISIYAGYLYNEDTSTYVSTLELDPGGILKADNVTLVSGAGGVLTFADGTTQSTAAVGIPSAGTTGQVLKKNSGTNYDVSWGAMSGVDVQTFGSSSTSGSFTWTKPANAKWVEFLLIGGGAGGGSGARQATSVARSGAGGGAGGPSNYGRINASYLGSTETVVVGAGGTGAASITVDSTAGANGNAGGSTTFSLFQSGSAGAGSGSGTGGVARASVSFVGNSATLAGGGAGAATGGSNSTNYSAYWQFGLGGGGGAGAAAASTVNATGGNGGGISSGSSSAGLISTIAGGAGGTSAGVAAVSGTSATTQFMIGGTGGGGGYYRTGVAGGAGANGGWPGGGGGGGGASDNGFASGAGGNGANGFAVIITYF